MRTIIVWICAIGALLALPSLASAEEACAAGTLGVSRVAEVDTTGGPWFGEPHGDRDFLAPGEVVLTFDDGPMPKYTRPILAALAAQCTKATFFVVGEMAAEYPELVKEVAAQGHTIGTHTWSHRNLARVSLETAQTQIESTFTTVETAAGQPIAPFFRYPYLSDNPAVVAYLKSRNIGQFAIDVDSLDWRTRDPQSIIHRVMAGLAQRGKGIILFHDIHPSTANALPELLAQLKKKGFNVVHLRPRNAAQTIADYRPPVKEVRRGSPYVAMRAKARQRTPQGYYFFN